MICRHPLWVTLPLAFCVQSIVAIAPASAVEDTFIVTSIGDAAEVTPGDGTCGNSDQPCTLRAAIMEANAHPGTDTIRFALSGSAPHVISPMAELPEITDPVVIDGSTQPGFVDLPVVVLRGNHAPPHARGLVVTSGSTVVRSMEISLFGSSAIEIRSPGANVLAASILAGNGTGGIECDIGNVEGEIVRLPFGALHAKAVDINDCGQIVGVYPRRISPTKTQPHAFLWLPAEAYGLPAGLNDLGSLSEGDVSSVPVAMNDRGDVIGFASIASVGSRSFLWLPENRYGLTAGMHDLADHGCADCAVADINNKGQIVGGFPVIAQTSTTQAEGHAFRWERGIRSDLGILPDAYEYTFKPPAFRTSKFSAAFSINDLGQSVGGSSCGHQFVPAELFVDNSVTICDHAVAWDGTGGPMDLGTLGTYVAEVKPQFSSNAHPTITRDQSGAFEINRQGQIIGYSTRDEFWPWPPGAQPSTNGPATWQTPHAIPPGFSPTSINDLGDILGTVDNVSEGAVLWHDGTLVKFEQIFGESVAAFPGAQINDAGAILAMTTDGSSDYLVSPPTADGLGLQGIPSSAIRIIDSPANIIGGIGTGDGNIIVDGGGVGVSIEGTGSTGNHVAGNRIGVHFDGATPGPNESDGVLLEHAPGSLVQNNIIAANARDGIHISGQGATDSVIVGNHIGIDASGTVPHGNGGSGVKIDGGARARIGGVEPTDRNYISANHADGIQIVGSTAVSNVIQGNFVGTDESGSQSLGNDAGGVVVEAASNNVVGGVSDEDLESCTGPCNLISGNDGNGVLLTGEGAFSNTVEGNFVGVDVTGLSALGNFNGVLIENAPGNEVGGLAAGAKNVISGNRLVGVYISSSGASGNSVLGNLIGPDVTGAPRLGNGLHGVRIDGAPHNALGDVTPAGRNVIAGNAGSGIVVKGDAAVGNALRGNLIHTNRQLGIDLGDDGPTFNDATDSDGGPNETQNYPIVLDKTVTPESTFIWGKLSSANPETAKVDLYASADAASGQTAPAETYLGTVVPETSGAWFFSMDGSPPREHINATATDAAGSTSEFNQVVPLIFVPGIAGSRLVVDDPTESDGVDELWPGGTGPHDRLTLNSQDPDYTSGIYAPDVIRTVEIAGVEWEPIYGPLLSALVNSGGYREYKVDGKADRRTAAGCDTTNQADDHPSLFVFAYDWRRSIVESADLLDEYVRCVRTFYRDSEVNIVGHSMGGLVARRYILDHPDDNHVNKLITIATPFLGTPRVVYAMETGDYGFINVFPVTLRELLGSFTGAHELIPSREYSQLSGYPVLVEDGRDWDGNGTSNDHFTYDELGQALNTKYGVDVFHPGSASMAFHDFFTPRGGQDDWSTDTTGVHYIHIYGVQSVEKTVSALIAKKEMACEEDGSNCLELDVFDPIYGLGDESVPISSASRIGANGDTLNDPSADRYAFCSHHPSTDEDVEHNGLHRNVFVQQWLLNVLRYNSPSSFPETCGPGLPTPGLNFPRPSLNVPGRGVDSTYSEVVIAGGRNTAIAAAGDDGQKGGARVGGAHENVDRHFDGEGLSGAVFPSTGAYTVTFESSGDPMFVELRVGLGDEPVEAVRYRDLVIPEGASASFSVGPGRPILSYDSDGDDSFETTVQPSAYMSGSQVDMRPPEVGYEQLSDGGAVFLHINATDSDSGLKSIHYSLDGSHFVRYAGRVNLDADETREVYVYADDNAANRSTISIVVTGRSKAGVEGVFIGLLASMLPIVFAARHRRIRFGRRPPSSRSGW